MDDKLRFSKRLQTAMMAAGLEARPTVLEKLFNLHYPGTPVSYQGVRRWLLGLSVPEQDKLELLASLLGTEPNVLRYGNKADQSVPVPKAGWTETTDIDDRVAIEVFLRLSPKKRQAIRQIIHAMVDRTQGHKPG